MSPQTFAPIPQLWARLGKSRWLNLLCFTLLGYALLGKGFAYLPAPPIFIGEWVLLLGLIWLYWTGRWSSVWESGEFLPLMALAAWGVARTGPYLSQYGMDALRDAAIWGYGVFAAIIFCYVLDRPSRLTVLVRRYRTFANIFLLAIPAIWLFTRFCADRIPQWPWADAPVIDAKGGDILVHFAGVLAFWISGLGGRARGWRLLLLFCGICLVGVYNRGGLVSVLAATALCAYLKPLDRNLWRLAALGASGVLLFAAADVRFQAPGKDREVSVDQLVSNLASVAFDDGDDRLGGTKEWRLNWWSDIYDYTVNGPYFWTGKGFGINLADADGYQGDRWEGRLRSPHNGHLTMLARGGLPGFLLWLLVQLAWVWRVGRGYLDSRRAGDEQWAALFLFLLAYWTAFLANATFDVFLEGPMGGVWFWTIYGTGLAAAWMYRNGPDPALAAWQADGQPAANDSHQI